MIGAPLIIVGILTGVAWYKARRPVGVMTAERDRVYRAAIGGALKTPEKLRELAKAFEKERLYPQAAVLRQRADLKELPPEVKQERNQVFRRAMKSKNKAAILAVADAYDKEGCTSACEKLRAYADGLPDVGVPTSSEQSEDNSHAEMDPPSNSAAETETSMETIQ